jgi:thiamine pyrophosphate-dependent acetolactate synthase large subunit-like protein
MALTRIHAVRALHAAVPSDAGVVYANGYISRAGHACDRRARNFFMIGSMGLAASIALGVALRTDGDPPVVVVDGDGNVLMGLGALPMVGAWRPKAFLHVVLDNRTYASTGGQATVAHAVDLPAAGRACGYAAARAAVDEPEIAAAVAEWRGGLSPYLLRVAISPDDDEVPERVAQEPAAHATQFQAWLARTAEP